MSKYYDHLEQDMKESLKQIQRQHKTRRKGRRGLIEVYFEPERCEEEIDQRTGREEMALAGKQLADISREFLKIKKVYRRHLKKISELSDDGVIHACHCYVEENRLNDEWKEFRKSREIYY